MIRTTTSPPQTPRYDNGGYRYFFLAGYEFREYDTRLGRWWGIDQKAEKYPSLSPYQFCADSPIRMVDVDGSDFVVIIEKSGSENIITVKMNVYSASQEAYKQLLPAVAEINSITRKVTIDDVEYTLDISNDDIKIILRFAFLFNYGKHNNHRVRVDYLDETEPIRPNPEIEVK